MKTRSHHDVGAGSSPAVRPRQSRATELSDGLIDALDPKYRKMIG